MDVHVLRALARNPAAPPDVLRRLGSLVETATVDETSRPSVVVEQCPDDEETRAETARDPRLPRELHDRFATDPSALVRGQFLLRQDITEDLRNRLYAQLKAEDDGDLNDASFALAHLNAVGMAWLRTLPLAERLARLNSPIPLVRREIARSDLPPEVAASLDEDHDLEVRRAVAHRPDVQAEVLERLVTDHGVARDGGRGLLDHPNFPPEAFTRLAKHPNLDRRHIALHRKDLPADIVASLLDDESDFVRREAVRHPNAPGDRVAALLDDREMAEFAAMSHALPVSAMTRLLERAGL